MSHVPPALAVVALDLDLIIPPNLILIVSGCIAISVTTLPLGPPAIVIGTLNIIPLTLIGSLSSGFLQCLLSLFNSCH